MTNSTIAQPSSAPIAKLYRMCGVYNAHAKCKGAFETHSVCSCPCHAKSAAPVKTTRKAKTRKVAPKPAPTVATAPAARPAAKLNANTTWKSVVGAVKAVAKPAAPKAEAIRADAGRKPNLRITFADGTSIDLSTVVAVSLV